MPDAKTIITRQALYELVWSKPATQIGSDHGVSGNAVAKACRKMNVPTPPRGYWAKLEHGKMFPKTPLPAPTSGQKESTSLGEHAGRKHQLPTLETPIVIESTEKPTPKKLHPAVDQTRIAYRNGTIQRVYGTISPSYGHRHLAVSVTKALLTRALDILNQLVWLLERNGFEFKDGDKEKNLIDLVYKATKTKIEFSLREGIERYDRELTAEEKARSHVFDRWSYRSTGLLRLQINEYHPQGIRKGWGDGQRQKLEERIPDIIENFILCAHGKHAQHLEFEARERRWAEEARLREEAARRLAAEKLRREQLQQAAAAWVEAQNLEKFINACEGEIMRRPDRPPEAEEWISWARGVARGINPLESEYLLKAIDEARR